MAAGRAGTATRKAKQERLLKQLRGAKESFRPPAGDGTSANIPPKEAGQEQAVYADKRPEHNREVTLDPMDCSGLSYGRGAHVSSKHANKKCRVGGGRPRCLRAQAACG